MEFKFKTITAVCGSKREIIDLDMYNSIIDLYKDHDDIHITYERCENNNSLAVFFTKDAYEDLGHIEIELEHEKVDTNKLDLEETLDDLLSTDAIKEICTSGDNTLSVSKWAFFHLSDLKRLGFSRKDYIRLLEKYCFESLEETKDSEIQLIEKAIWTVAWNIFDAEGLEYDTGV